MLSWEWLVPTAISVIAAISAAVAAVAAWKSARETRNSVNAQIVLQIMNEYSTPEMLRSIENIRNFYDKNQNNLGHAFIQLQVQDRDKYDILNGDRRRYSHHFHKIERLLATGTVKEDFITQLIKDAKNGQIDFLLNVIEPLEKALNPGYDHSTFDTFRRIYNK